MAYGFEVRNSSGAVMLSSNDITARLVGQVEVTTTSGYKNVSGITSSNSFPYLMGPGFSGSMFPNSEIWITNGRVNWSFDQDPRDRYYIMVFRHSG